jgi:hypothetical protein
MLTKKESVILAEFGLNPNHFTLNKFGSGHINFTFFVESTLKKENFILQKINTAIFKDPWAIAKNIKTSNDYLQHKNPDYLFIHPILTICGKEIFEFEDEHWRMSPYIFDSYSIDVVSDPKMAYEAAKAFGTLTKNLNGMSVKDLNQSIPGFHDLAWRYEQFEDAIKTGNKNRIKEQQEVIAFFEKHKNLVDQYIEITKNEDYPIRMIHHDTKINNVLFDQNTKKNLCVCDLDTLMPGYIISDLGDMVRTYTCELSEESTEFKKISVRLDFFKSLMQGYLSELKDLLTTPEKQALNYAGPFIVYMQGLRFLTDYINNDIYYPVKYPTHNLDRSTNQKILLEDLLNKKSEIDKIIADLI